MGWYHRPNIYECQDSNIDKTINKYKTWVWEIEDYLRSVPYTKWVDAYLKSSANKYEPGELKDVGTSIFNELNKVIKTQMLDDEADSLAFYKIRELGKGACGTVELVKTNSTVVGTEAKIAVKTLTQKAKHNKKINKHQLEYEKSIGEFNILYESNHPNIMKSYLKWETSKQELKIGLEYLPCKDLKELVKHYENIKCTRKLPIDLVRHIAVEIIQALSYMRTNKILHRDIKPDNIMLDDSFHIKLADFGFGARYNNDKKNKQSKIYRQATKKVKHETEKLIEKANDKQKEIIQEAMNEDSDSDSDISLVGSSPSLSKCDYLSSMSSRLTLCWGTIPYMAPELHLIGAGSHEADVWAMGVMIYELLAGHLPWEQYEINKMSWAYYSFPEDFDESAKELINGCLTVDPSKRIGWGKGEHFEEAMFALDFFKDIDTNTIHQQTPPIDKEIVYSINQEVNEEYDNKLSESENKLKHYDSKILFDNTMYEGKWLNKLRHGDGTLYKIDPLTQMSPQKIYSGDWYKDQKHGKGIFYHNKYTLTGEWKEDSLKSIFSIELQSEWTVKDIFSFQFENKFCFLSNTDEWFKSI